METIIIYQDVRFRLTGRPIFERAASSLCSEEFSSIFAKSSCKRLPQSRFWIGNRPVTKYLAFLGNSNHFAIKATHARNIAVIEVEYSLP